MNKIHKLTHSRKLGEHLLCNGKSVERVWFYDKWKNRKLDAAKTGGHIHWKNVTCNDCLSRLEKKVMNVLRKI